MTTRSKVIALAAVLGLVLAACGEQPQVVRYEQGKYQGNSDTRPWEGPVFNGDKGAWEQAMRARVRGQNEYARVE
jgi:uncharacterized lipoprotein